jgi:PAS domain S-box-containing protein
VEESLLQESNFSRAAFDSLTALFYMYDDQGRFIRWNEYFKTITGYSDEELVRMTPLDVVLENERASLRHTMETVLATKHVSAELSIVSKDGSVRPHFLTGNLIEFENKQCVIGMGIDITERKQAEENLKRYHEHLEELVRERTINLEATNKELESFSYSASHDLRAPLRTIEGFSQALLEDYKDKLDIRGNDYLMRIKAATQHMALLIEDMLKLSRITRTEMNIGKVNLTRIAQSVIDELQKSQPQRHVDIRIANGLEVRADAGLMSIVLENLLCNAWKFTEKQAEAVIEFGLTAQDGKKVYFIRDNGAGFDMAFADKLFSPFQRLHSMEEYPGTGIGLATVRRIINRHGGKIRAEGQTGKGATFYFSLQE